MEKGKAYFVTGIDTDAGKTYATGFIASQLARQGHSVITQKFVQTGCGDDRAGISEDIRLHRRIMGLDILPEDLDGTTCCQMFAFPASADLAARLEGRRVDLRQVAENTDKLLSKYDIVLIEGAGGIMVPVDGDYTTLDYIVEMRYPVILVTNPKLGSLNHTLLTLEACRTRGVELSRVVYNHYPVTSDTITDDTRRYLRRYLSNHFPLCSFSEVPFVEL